MERENLAGDAKGKGTSGSNREAESTDAPERGGLLRNSTLKSLAFSPESLSVPRTVPERARSRTRRDRGNGVDPQCHPDAFAEWEIMER